MSDSIFKSSLQILEGARLENTCEQPPPPSQPWRLPGNHRPVATATLSAGVLAHIVARYHVCGAVVEGLWWALGGCRGD